MLQWTPRMQQIARGRWDRQPLIKDKEIIEIEGGVLFGSCFGGGGGDDDTDDDDEEKQHEDEGSSRDKNRYIDPPMPYMGKTMNFAKLMDRSFYARKVSAEILKVINKDALISLEESKSIPVTNDMYRVVITKVRVRQQVYRIFHNFFPNYNYCRK